MKRLTRRTALRDGVTLALSASPLSSIVYAEGVHAVMITSPAATATVPVTIRDVWPDQATYRPREPAAVHVALANATGEAWHGALEMRLSWLDEVIATVRRRVAVPSEGTTETLPLPLPHDSFRGYGVDLAVRDEHGRLLAEGTTALDVLEDWTQAPRYGFLSDFTPGTLDPAAAVDTLSRYHINVAQFYDWMWRHYALMPPSDEFADALGRRLSLRIVRDKVRACRERGMAALGYAAVYGAEPEYALAHPDEILYDAAGEPYSLEKLFYIMNIHRGNPWRARILAEMARAVREVPFDGLHLDQYGFPKDQAFGPKPRATPYDLSEDFPPFIDDARVAVRAARAGARVIFNAVGNWPIETVASTTQDATYIEVWPPYDGYADLQTLILEARRLAPAKQVILAAYVKPLQGATGDNLPPAEAATRLTSAAIWANGGFHLLLGESNAALCDPYYPAYATMTPAFARVMRRYYDFVVRYENALADPRLVTAAGARGLEATRVEGAAASPFAEPGTVWTVARAMPGLHTVSLINLRGVTEANWNTPQPTPPSLHDVEVKVRVDGAVRAIFAASPDGDDLRAIPLAVCPFQRGGATWVGVRLPRLDYWSLIVVKTEPAGETTRNESDV